MDQPSIIDIDFPPLSLGARKRSAKPPAGSFRERVGGVVRLGDFSVSQSIKHLHGRRRANRPVERISKQQSTFMFRSVNYRATQTPNGLPPLGYVTCRRPSGACENT